MPPIQYYTKDINRILELQIYNQIIMKKTLLSIMAILPMSLFAQAPSGDSGSSFMNIIIAIIILVIIFLVCREIVCWYWKINKTISNQEEIIRLLKKIAKEDNTYSTTNQSTIDPFHK